jgi:DUF4097 and DUF4098 domain-containing protein YvlB
MISTGAQADDCKFEKNIAMNLDLSGTETLSVIAGAGMLSITGAPGSDEAVIKGRACASSEKWLEETGLETRSGDLARIEVELPDTDGGWSLLGNRYARLDLELTVPEGLKLDVVDSSGSMTIENVADLHVKDSSGSMKIRDVKGSLSVKDSSGSMTLTGIEGDVTIISDSSGSIKGQDISGSVLVRKDSSGSIRFTDVGRDFVVERDSSGDIVAERIGGDFRVLKDGSGKIRSSDVAGEVSVPID